MKSGLKSTYRAFTLWEVLITLILTSILVSLSYGTYHTFSHILQRDSEQANGRYEMLELERNLHRWTTNCESIYMEDECLVFESGEHEKLLEFSDSLVTLFHDGESEELSYILRAWEIDFLDAQSSLVTSFRIRCSNRDQDYRFSLRKQYDKLFLYQHAVNQQALHQ